MAIYLVTGGAGFIGSHLVDALLARGHRVRVLDDLSSGRIENLPSALLGEPGSDAPLEFYRGSIEDAELCRGACTGIAGVFHEAAQVSVPRSVEDPRTSYSINVTGTLNVLEGARLAGVPRVVFAASSAAYGNSEELPKVESMLPQPLSPYASGKIAGEHLLRVYAHVYGVRTVALRYFNIFGPRQADDSPYTGVIAIFAKALLEGRRAKIFGDGSQTRDFTYVDNVVDANLRAMERDVEPGSVINIGGGRRVSILELYRRMAEILGKDLEPILEPPRSGDVRDSLASLERARVLLGYEPSTTWEQGLDRTVAWYREHAEHARR
ncbi:MAG: SDR family oxidoreductase [Planctomycetes bacterium]|nr:SDR family oxidoreductase [Planctomycetota bacterium]